MKVCIIGKGLIGLALAKALVNQGIYVDLFSSKSSNNYDKYRTLGISKANLDFFNKNILDIKKILWKINKIEIFSENLKNEKILNFENYDTQLFSIIKNYKLYEYLISSLNENKFFQLKKFFNLKKLLEHKHKLIINCENNNPINKKFFEKRIIKNYHSFAHTTVINHKRFLNNHTAIQFFTEKGPLAFLPVSEFETSIVYSARGLKMIDLKSLINQYNKRYNITKINKASNIKLNLVNLRSYHYKNILAFGDLLHRLHPLAGQGFNMSIRDIKELLNIIKFRKNLGLELDNSICVDFEKKVKHRNYLFSRGIDFVYEFFNFENKASNPIFTKSLRILARNEYANSLFKKFADKGIEI